MAVPALWFSLAALALLTGQMVHGQCNQTDIALFIFSPESGLSGVCTGYFATLQVLQTRAAAAAMAGEEINLTETEMTALNGACVESCVGVLVDYLEDNMCPQDDINGLAGLCNRNPVSTNLCIPTIPYVQSRIAEAVAACNTTGMTCPANCSALLPELYGNGGCCMKTRLSVVPTFDAVVDLFCGYFDLCPGVVGAAECILPFVDRSGQECTDVGIQAFVESEASGVTAGCQSSFATVQSLRNRAAVLIAAGQPVVPTAAEKTALNLACDESCIGVVVDYLQDTCTQEQADELASLCTRNPGSGNTCIQTISYVESRVDEAVAACDATGTTCPAACSDLLPELYGNGGCCMKTTVSIVPLFDSVVDMFCGYFDSCEGDINVDTEECTIPFVDCTGDAIERFIRSEASGVSDECQDSFATVQSLQDRAAVLIAAGQPVVPTANETSALNLACAESCIGVIVDYLQDACTQEQATELASLCTRNPDSGNTCIQTIPDVEGRVDEAVAACDATGTTCPAACSDLLPDLFGNGGCCMKTTVSIVPQFDSVVDLFCGYFDSCEGDIDVDAEACTIPFIGSGTTIFIAKTLLVLTVFIATFLNIA